MSFVAMNYGQNVIQVLSPVPPLPPGWVVYAGSRGLFGQNLVPLDKASLQRIEARWALLRDPPLYG